MTDILKLIAYQAIYYLARTIRARANGKHLMLVKIDEIGDYVLIRRLLHYFKNSPEYREYRITFVGNQIFRELFENFDINVSDNVIWIDKKKFRRNLIYRYSFLKGIRKAGFSDTINLIYSRSWRQDDMLVAVSTAYNRIGMNNDGKHLSGFENFLRPSTIYNQLLDGGEEHLFDGYRNAAFVKQLVTTQTEHFSTFIPAKSLPITSGLPTEYFVVFPGSGLKEKKWSPQNFAVVAHHLVKQFGFEPVVCGSAGDREDCERFIESFQASVVNLTAKTNLTELLSVLKSARCLLSVDTGVVHLAAAVGCPVFGLFSGIHYGRFAPYPVEVAENFFAIYPDEVDKMIEHFSIVEEEIPVDLVKNIRVEKVIDKINNFFDAQKDQITYRSV